MEAARRKIHTHAVTDFEAIAKVISFMDEHYRDQPNLENLAEQVGYSQYHFHRLFVRWAGVTPKEFLQCLTLNHAKARLLQGESVLNASLEVGLSGPSRLHDLAVEIESASPGEIKSGGKGLHIRYGTSETPFGEWLVGECARGICHVSFMERNHEGAGVRHEIFQKWPEASYEEDHSVAIQMANRVFVQRNHGVQDSFRAYVKGTKFQVQVWRALLEVPSGSLTSYGNLAAKVGIPSAMRAVGSAVGQNPIAYLIPCHRVIRGTGAIGQYRWNVDRKRAMIGWETASELRGETI